MKRIILILAIFCLTQISFAQYDPQAYKILEEMSAKYKSFDAFSAKISYSLVNEVEGISENFAGEIFIKDEKYRLVMDEQIIVNNGETVWTYLPDVNEVTIDNYDPENGDITPSKIYSAYKDGFKYLYLEDITEDGETLQIVDLVPENAKDKQFFKIRLEIGKQDNMLKSWTMFDKGGNKYIYDVKEFDKNTNPKGDLFTFDVTEYKGIEVIDLR